MMFNQANSTTFAKVVKSTSSKVIASNINKNFTINTGQKVLVYGVDKISDGKSSEISVEVVKGKGKVIKSVNDMIVIVSDYSPDKDRNLKVDVGSFGREVRLQNTSLSWEYDNPSIGDYVKVVDVGGSFLLECFDSEELRDV